ncbi:SDR family NAD(P)-dependent oxidoreductase [Nocardia sp. CA-135398]|uniref:SDR family NAD(P)-dependent oxidoreductase n=1 Tax=Nocardia sp. CA-135398 TaxID=3239977 RepID=UPI003D96FCD8
MDRDRDALGRFDGMDGVIGYGADVTVEQDVQGYARAAAQAWGRVDMFANNAGIEGSVAPIPDYDTSEFDRVIAANVRGAFLGLKYVLPLMSSGGAVVNMSSALGLVGAAGIAPYVASKHAVIGLTKSAALEQAPNNIRINAVCPGPIAGRMIDDLEARAFAGTDTTFANFVPLGRHGDAEEVADFVVYLLSEKASYLTGTAHSVDGGFVTA